MQNNNLNVVSFIQYNYKKNYFNLTEPIVHVFLEDLIPKFSINLEKIVLKFVNLPCEKILKKD